MASTMTTAVTSNGTSVPLSAAILTVHSNEVLYTASPILRFDQVATVRTELGVAAGRQIQFVKYSSLSGNTDLTEATAIETTNLVGTTVTITVAEMGRAVRLSELLLHTAFTNTMRDAVRILGQDYAKAVDSKIRDALTGTSNVLYANNKSRTTLDVNDIMTTGLIRDAVEQLQINKAPKIRIGVGDEAYVCFVHPHQVRKLKNDPAWVNASNYGNPSNVLRGELGRFDDVVFISTTQVPYVLQTTGDVYVDGADSGANSTANANTNVYRAVICGENAVGWAESLPVQLRDGGVLDLGRYHDIGWYSIAGAGLVEESHVYVLETA